jgi:hypothetical protein
MSGAARWAGRLGLAGAAIVLAYATLFAPFGFLVCIISLAIFGWIAFEGPRDAALMFAGLAIVVSSALVLLTTSPPGISCVPKDWIQSLFCTPPDLTVDKWVTLAGFGALVLAVGILMRFRARRAS